MKKVELFWDKVKKIYHFFGRLITSCFAVILIVIGLIYAYAQIPVECHGLVLPQMSGNPTTPWYQTIDVLEILGYVFSAAFLVGVCAGFIYLVLGVVRFFGGHSKKNKDTTVKLFVVRGVISIVIFFLLFFAISSEIQIVPLCL